MRHGNAKIKDSVSCEPLTLFGGFLHNGPYIYLHPLKILFT